MISAVYLRVLHHTVKLRRRLGRAYSTVQLPSFKFIYSIHRYNSSIH